jgi:two-component system chemotaxis sensor kinase CheA
MSVVALHEHPAPLGTTVAETPAPAGSAAKSGGKKSGKAKKAAAGTIGASRKIGAPGKNNAPRNAQEADVKAPVAKTDDVNHPKPIDSQMSTAAETSIRVDVDLLDTLVRQVGELVLARNRISSLAGARDADPELVSSSQQLGLIASELQERVMRTRLQPIEHAWSRMPRVVRDIAAACGKEVALKTAGGDTELDRGLLETVKDPLTHLVRNAIDHGIEAPAARQALGKDRRGTLTLRARHAGGQVIVEIEDDGKGIDPKLIGEKAIEKGLRTRTQVETATDAELLQLLFLPGFSTAEAVTTVSGRGVGMDVVRSNVEAVGGTVDVESTPGHGTLWRLRIPLTMAIMPTLNVMCDGDVYALPQAQVIELVAIDPQRTGMGIEYVSNAPVYRLRGELLPLVPLREVLGVGDVTGENPDGPGVIVVVQSDAERLGVLVDRVLSSEEIVVTPLSARVKAIGVYAGATVVGDGTVALILDLQAIGRVAFGSEVEGIVKRAEQEASRAAAAVVTEKVLVVGVGGRRVAMPLASVARLESLNRGQIELVGGREVVFYRDHILPLARLGMLLGQLADVQPTDEDEVLVVVISHGKRSVGLVVDEVRDIVDDVVDTRSDIDDNYLLGSTVIGGRVTELLDVRSAVLAADPVFDLMTDDDLVGAAR